MDTPGGAVGSKASRSEPGNEDSKCQASITWGHLHVPQLASGNATELSHNEPVLEQSRHQASLAPGSLHMLH